MTHEEKKELARSAECAVETGNYAAAQTIINEIDEVDKDLAMALQDTLDKAYG